MRRLGQTAALAALAAAACLSACSAGNGGGDRSRSAVQVAEDEHATAREVVAAGAAVDADAATNGSRLVLYRVMGEDSEVVQTAWRLYGPDGDRVTEGKGGTEVIGLDDGFWIGDATVVDEHGEVRRVPTAKHPTAPRPGDVVIDDFEQIEALRQHPLRLFPPSPVPRGFGQGWTLDREGRQWYQRVEPEQLLVGGPRGEDAFRQVRTVPHAAGEEQLGFGVTVVGDRLVLPTVRSAPHDRLAVTGIGVRRVEAPPRSPWRVLDPGPLASGAWELAPRAFAVDERHYLFSDVRREPYVLDLGSGDWQRLRLPDDRAGWQVEPGIDGLYAVPADDGNDPTDAWLSPDLGRSWQQLSR